MPEATATEAKRIPKRQRPGYLANRAAKRAARKDRVAAREARVSARKATSEAAKKPSTPPAPVELEKMDDEKSNKKKPVR